MKKHLCRLSAAIITATLMTSPAQAFSFFGKDSLTKFREHAPADSLFYIDSKYSKSMMSYEYPESMKDLAQLEQSLDLIKDTFEIEDQEKFQVFETLMMDYMTAAYDGPEAIVKEYGLAKNLASAIYLDGLFPVMHFALNKDNDVFTSKILSVIDDLSIETLNAQVQGEDIYLWGLPRIDDLDVELSIAMSINDNIATIALVHNKMTEERKALVLGLEKESESLASEKTMKSLTKEYGFNKVLTGYIDFVAIGNTILDIEQSTAGKDFTVVAGEEMVAGISEFVTEQCNQEAKNIIKTIPRFVFGVNDYKMKDLRSIAKFTSILEINHAEAMAELISLNGHIPGYTQSTEDKFGSFALGFNGNKVSTVLNSMWSRIAEQPYECSYITMAQGFLTELDVQKALMGSAMLNGIQGAGAALYDMNVDEETGLSTPDMLVTLTAENPMALVNLAKMAAPLDGINDIAENETVDISIPGYEQINVQVSVVGNHIGVFTGEKSAAAFELESKEPINQNGLVSFNFNYSNAPKMLAALDDSNFSTDSEQCAGHSTANPSINALEGMDGELIAIEKFTDKGLVNTFEIDITINDSYFQNIKIPGPFNPIGTYQVDSLDSDCNWEPNGLEVISEDNTGFYELTSDGEECPSERYFYQWTVEGLSLNYLETGYAYRDSCDAEWIDEEIEDEYEYSCIVTNHNTDGFECAIEGDEGNDVYRYTLQK